MSSEKTKPKPKLKTKLKPKPTKPKPTKPNVFEVPDFLTKNSEGVITIYEVCEYLGKGSYSQCFKVKNTETDKYYAAKITKINKVSDICLQFIDGEIDIHSKLNHPNIVKFIDTFKLDNKMKDKLLIIILELCEGGSLKSLVRKKRINEKEARYYLLGILSGVQYIHNKYYIHRDIKIENILLTRDNVVKICDFGMAKYERDTQITKCGTPNYISPEVLCGCNNTYLSDIWAIGVTLYTMIIGKPPFETTNIKTTYSRIKSSTFDFPDRIVISDSVKDLIKKILVIVPENRLKINEIMEHSFFKIEFPPKETIRFRINTTFKTYLDSDSSVDTTFTEPVTWITQYFNDDKFGLFYKFNNGEFGALYNDNSIMVTIHPDDIIYIKRSGRREILKHNNIKKYSKNINKKMKLISWAIKFFPAGKNLIGPIGQLDQLDKCDNKNIFVKKWTKTKIAIFFHSNDNKIQIRFNDNNGIIIAADGRIITHISPDLSMNTYLLHNIPTSIMDYIKYIQKTFEINII